jgi:ABC-type antimicrobial peptide transport system permease subunit
MGGAVREQRFTATLMAGLALLTLALAAIGIYGVMSYSVARRNQEIGVRLALGAAPYRVRRLVIAEGMIPAVIGIGVGLAAAIGLSRFLGEILYGVGPLDPPTFIAVPFLLVCVALGSVLGPAHRATRVDPVVALRRE